MKRIGAALVATLLLLGLAPAPPVQAVPMTKRCVTKAEYRKLKENGTVGPTAVRLLFGVRGRLRTHMDVYFWIEGRVDHYELILYPGCLKGRWASVYFKNGRVVDKRWVR